MAPIFRYKKIDRPGPLGTIYAPAIPVTFSGVKESLDVIALLDSGADTTAIPKGIAEILELDLSGAKEHVVGIGGKLSAVASTLTCTVKGVHEKYIFPLHVKVLLEEAERFPILLGRKDFFENFNITFREKERKIVLKKA